MRTLKWDPLFNLKKETTTAIAWISFPSLPPNFFGKEAIFSLAAAVGKPLQVDMATRNQTRPSCASVKVEVDLLREFPKRIKIGMRMKTDEVVEKWMKIKYDYVPKYCQTCMIQGHDEEQCYVVHPDLHPNREKSEYDEGKKVEGKHIRNTNKDNDTKEKESEQHHGRKKDEFVEQKHRKWGGAGRNKEPVKVWNKVGIAIGNKFNLLDSRNLVRGEDQIMERVNEKEAEQKSVQAKVNSPGRQNSNNKELEENTSNKALMEPFQNPSVLEQYKMKLGFDKAASNCNGKIWYFWKDEWMGSILLDTIQQVTIQFKHNNKEFIISVVYAMCNASERLELWEELESIVERVQCPWIIEGDFNVILNEEEKLGGLEFSPNEAIDFAAFISSGALSEFKNIVEENWKVDFAGNPFIEFHAKLKKVKKELSIWSKEVFGDIFQQIATIEDIIKVKEAQLEIQHSATNRAELSKEEAKLKKFLKLEEDFWRQKAGMKWCMDGDRNTNFFHSFVKGRRKKLHIAEMITEQGVTLSTNDEIREAAVQFYKDQFSEFSEERRVEEYSMLEHIPKCITNAENEVMTMLPD
ncbi:uncharacterized protein LOC125876094 [Solanum stenotomum]|uniref:uncharacterized protein LOC125876094 n=1 Tax=Solanum stenotomum TaxID=172797 RepID=UPI0020D0145A|nr:uncharacterized protein LOC125876094 [Solanum stenotomum]